MGLIYLIWERAREDFNFRNIERPTSNIEHRMGNVGAFPRWIVRSEKLQNNNWLGRGVSAIVLAGWGSEGRLMVESGEGGKPDILCRGRRDDFGVALFDILQRCTMRDPGGPTPTSGGPGPGFV